MKPSFEDEITMKVKGIVSNSIFSKIRAFESNGSVWKIADDSIALYTKEKILVLKIRASVLME